MKEDSLLILQIFNENEPLKKKFKKEKSIGENVNKDKIGKNKNSVNKRKIMHNTKIKSSKRQE